MGVAKHQLQLCNRFVINHGFQKDIQVSKFCNIINDLSELNLDANVQQLLINECNNCLQNFKKTNYVQIFGTKYKENNVIVVRTENDVLEFGCIKDIFCDSAENIYFIYQNLITQRYHKKFHGYEILYTNNYNNCIKQSSLSYPYPVLVSSVGIKNIVTLRYAIQYHLD